MTTILIAEDNPMVGLLMQTDLMDAGYEVLGPFPRNAAAEDAARERRIDLALIDIDLAGGDSGIDLAARLSGERGVACVFVTGQSIEAATASAHAIGVLTKPVPSAALVAAVEAALRIAGGDAAPPDEGPAAWFGRPAHA